MFFYEIDFDRVGFRQLFAMMITFGGTKISCIARCDQGKGGQRSLQNSSVEHWLHNRLAKQLIKTRFIKHWPGTTLTNGTAKGYQFRLNPETVDAICREADDIGRWHNDNGLPEDWFVLADGCNAPLMVTVTHENEGWVILPNEPSTTQLDFFCEPSINLDELQTHIPETSDFWE